MNTTTPFSRRRFLQAGAVGAGGLAMTPWLSQLQALAAPPVKSNEGILVTLMMDGGNDGLNTLIPHYAGKYYDLRPNLAIAESAALPVGTTGKYGLHPSLTRLKKRYDAGKVAIVRGVGYQNPDLSHFESMDIWARGWGGGGMPMTGWLGRWLDELPNAMSESLYGVTIGGSVPMHLTGHHSRPAGLPMSIEGAFGMDRDDLSDRRMYNAVKFFGNDPSGLGTWGDAYGDALAQLMDLTVKVGPAYAHDDAPDTHLGHQLALCAHLINANLGIRVLDVHIGGFDTHAGQPAAHAELLAEIDEAIEAFFNRIGAQWRDQVCLMTFSEFGRRPESNDDAGTDHGTASCLFVIGANVRGSLQGEQPRFLDLDDNGNLKPQVDFRQVYATIIEKWLRADDQEILGKTYSQLPLFRRGPGS